jgi:hypothetical protein
MIELREFVKEDWHAWAGAESEKPLIGENSGPGWHTTMIVDDEHIQIVFMDSNGFSDGRYIMIDFPTKGSSLLFALKIDLTEEPEVLEFIAREMGGNVENIFNAQVGRV